MSIESWIYIDNPLPSIQETTHEHSIMRHGKICCDILDRVVITLHPIEKRIFQFFHQQSQCVQKYYENTWVLLKSFDEMCIPEYGHMNTILEKIRDKIGWIEVIEWWKLRAYGWVHYHVPAHRDNELIDRHIHMPERMRNLIVVLHGQIELALHEEDTIRVMQLTKGDIASVDVMEEHSVLLPINHQENPLSIIGLMLLDETRRNEHIW